MVAIQQHLHERVDSVIPAVLHNGLVFEPRVYGEPARDVTDYPVVKLVNEAKAQIKALGVNPKDIARGHNALFQREFERITFIDYALWEWVE